jgi:hypothetical protein
MRERWRRELAKLEEIQLLGEIKKLNSLPSLVIFAERCSNLMSWVVVKI